MNNFEQSLSIFTSSPPGQVWAIFDVDRVLLNTTSWFRACKTPNLLMSPKNIERFSKLNDETYNNSPTLSKETFRKKTLELLDQRITQGFMDLVGKEETGSSFKLGSIVQEDKLYFAGKYIAGRLHIYEEPFIYLRYLSRYYGNNLKILYLTAGYAPFIRGLVDGIHELQKVVEISHEVFGSRVIFSEGRGQELFVCHGELKRLVAEKIIKTQGIIVFACDDDPENESLLRFVNQNGGKTLHVRHMGSELANASWSEFIKLNLSLKQVRWGIERGSGGFSTYNTNDIVQDYSYVFDKFKSRINRIGIVGLPEKKYQRALESLLRRFQLPTERRVLRHFFSNVTFKKRQQVFLRGKYYYHWLPEYIFLDPRTNYEKWLAQMKYCADTLEIIDGESLLVFWKELERDEKLLILCLFDNYKNAILHALNTINAASIEGNKSISYELLQYIDSISALVTDLYYQLLLDEYDEKTLREFMKKINITKLDKAMDLYQENQIGMRELDDPKTIVLSILSTIQQMKVKHKQYDYLVDFPCGGIELGLAFQSIYKILNKDKPFPKIIHCYYSSKKRLRKPKSFIRQDKEWLSQFVPRNYLPHFKKSYKEGKILLYDNNAMTFNTLAEVKEYFKTVHNKKVDAVVAAVSYQNIAKYLLSYKKTEELYRNWKDTLDYKPVCSYVTAFNTWGTSEKSKILESIFTIQPKKVSGRINKNTSGSYPIYKVCRVHNFYDLRLALRNGANMIGIHAVYDNRMQYIESQKAYIPVESLKPFESDLPIALHEVKSIRYMQKYIPRSLAQAIIFETKLDSHKIRNTVDVYGVKDKKLFIQLQHRTDKDHVHEIRANVTQNLIITIGAFQEDFYEYFNKIQLILNEKTDFILIDFSNHQPDLIHNKQILQFTHKEKLTRMKELTPILKKNKIPILLADDVSTKAMVQYLRNIGSYIQGIDMQNNTELLSSEQRYSLVYDDYGVHQIRVRKSADKLHQWGKFTRSRVFKQLGVDESTS